MYCTSNTALGYDLLHILYRYTCLFIKDRMQTNNGQTRPGFTSYSVLGVVLGWHFSGFSCINRKRGHIHGNGSPAAMLFRRILAMRDSYVSWGVSFMTINLFTASFVKNVLLTSYIFFSAWNDESKPKNKPGFNRWLDDEWMTLQYIEDRAEVDASSETSNLNRRISITFHHFTKLHCGKHQIGGRRPFLRLQFPLTRRCSSHYALQPAATQRVRWQNVCSLSQSRNNLQKARRKRKLPEMHRNGITRQCVASKKSRFSHRFKKNSTNLSIKYVCNCLRSTETPW